MKRVMNVQPAPFPSRLAPVPAPQQARIVLPDGVQPGWHKAGDSDLTGHGRMPAEPAATMSVSADGAPAALPPQQVIAGPPLPINAVQPGALPQDRAAAAMPAASFKQVPGSSPVDAFRHLSGPTVTGFGSDGLHWRNPPPGMLAALQEGGRARIEALFP